AAVFLVPPNTGKDALTRGRISAVLQEIVDAVADLLEAGLDFHLPGDDRRDVRPDHVPDRVRFRDSPAVAAGDLQRLGQRREIGMEFCGFWGQSGRRAGRIT